MKATKVVTCLLFSSIFIHPSSQTGQDQAKQQEILLNTIFKDYDKRIRPVKDHHSPVEVNFAMSLQQILQVDEKHQIITTNIWRTLLWRDDFLQWNPEAHGNISQISLCRSEIWAPDIQLYNSASYDTQLISHTSIVLKNDGQIGDVLPMVIKSTCKIDVTWFPFDEQKCSIIFGSWSLSAKVLRLELYEKATYTSAFINNGEWRLLGIGAERNLQFDPYDPDELFVVITYTIHLKRRAFYYFFNLLVPCGLIGFLAVLGFTLPPESGEKLPLGATILFSLIVFLNMIGETMPANSDAVPLLGTYFNCVMFTIALSVVSTIIVNLNLNAVNPKEVQGRSKKLFLSWLPWMLRMSPPPNILQGQMTSNKKKVGIATNSNGGVASDILWKQQWKFISVVVDRLCLVISLIFTFVSVTVFLIYAF